MILGIVIIGWIVGAASATLAVVLGDPGFLGAIGVFLSTSMIACLAAAVSYALRPDRQTEPSDTPAPDPFVSWDGPARGDLPLAAVARAADPLAADRF
jgi:hypothetical protein